MILSFCFNSDCNLAISLSKVEFSVVGNGCCCCCCSFCGKRDRCFVVRFELSGVLKRLRELCEDELLFCCDDLLEPFDTCMELCRDLVVVVVVVVVVVDLDVVAIWFVGSF